MPETQFLADSSEKLMLPNEFEKLKLGADPALVFEEYLKDLQAKALQLNFIRPSSGYKGL